MRTIDACTRRCFFVLVFVTPREPITAKRPIARQVQAPGLPDLTLIDLPGIVRTATKGQRASVMAEVNGLIQR